MYAKVYGKKDNGNESLCQSVEEILRFNFKGMDMSPDTGVFNIMEVTATIESLKAKRANK